MIRARLVPIARRMPISFCFCTTDTTSTLAMPSATTRITKNRIVPVLMFWLRIAASSCALVVIQLSASSPVSRSMRAATASAPKIVAHRQLDRGDPAGKIEQRLRELQRHEHPALVQVLVAEVEDARDRDHFVATLRRCRSGSCRRPRRRDPSRARCRSRASVPDRRKSPATMSSLMRTIRSVALGIDARAAATDLDAVPRCANAAPVAIGEAATTPGRAHDRRQERFPLIDRAQPLRPRLDACGDVRSAAVDARAASPPPADG